MAEKSRKLTVYGATKGTHFQSTPQIRLQGDWLKETGFSIGDNIQVVCKKNRLVITKAIENVG
ncbi:MAG: type I toxin-antitoxin system SymE family toxin [Lachnospiraceae bacterium]|nr:type I toxin-antitoxin system SymE family toxin [Lachnospiraceae bacterium]MBD5456520.1 type I toxin-antitoxin system SymE family toxin [Lachnospiraceae bacterium]